MFPARFVPGPGVVAKNSAAQLSAPHSKSRGLAKQAARTRGNIANCPQNMENLHVTRNRNTGRPQSREI
jgi:hypothetical protein